MNLIYHHKDIKDDLFNFLSHWTIFLPACLFFRGQIYDIIFFKLPQVQAYLYDGYWEDIGTIEAFYNANLGITKKPVPDFRYCSDKSQLYIEHTFVKCLPTTEVSMSEIYFSFYDRSSPIYTQPRYLPPSKMLDADVTDSVIGEGCVIKVRELQIPNFHLEKLKGGPVLNSPTIFQYSGKIEKRQ